ncbi:MAG: MnhB domain-containing protein [Trueperaceae bacterium]
MRAPEIFLRGFALPVTFAILAFGFHMLLRGHNAPGGGFIAGLMVAVAALLMRMARQQRLLSISPSALVPVGLVVALLTGAAPMLVGRPFLTSAYGYVRLPLLGEVEWASAALFDVGVFLVVIGVTVTIIELLTEHGAADDGGGGREG